jgi:DNA-directed RNA polymerase specialized sigma subunit
VKFLKTARLQHRLGSDPSIPRGIEPSRLEYLVVRLRSCEATTEERHELAVGHIRLGLAIAASYNVKCRREGGDKQTRGEDLASVAMFAITLAIDRAPEKLKDNNITGYIISTMKGLMFRFIVKDKVVRYTEHAHVLARRAGKKLPKIEAEELNDENPKVRRGIRRAPFSAPPDNRLRAIRERLSLCVDDERDERISEMRLQGYNDREIGEVLGISAQSVSKRREAMAARFDIYTAMEES